jgi:hypothetical protein
MRMDSGNGMLAVLLTAANPWGHNYNHLKQIWSFKRDQSN